VLKSRVSFASSPPARPHRALFAGGTELEPPTSLGDDRASRTCLVRTSRSHLALEGAGDDPEVIQSMSKLWAMGSRQVGLSPGPPGVTTPSRKTVARKPSPTGATPSSSTSTLRRRPRLFVVDLNGDLHFIDSPDRESNPIYYMRHGQRAGGDHVLTAGEMQIRGAVIV
jgi:hypothetical protein